MPKNIKNKKSTSQSALAGFSSITNKTNESAQFSHQANLNFLRKECVKIWSSLLFLDGKEVEKRLTQIQNLPVEGLEKLLIVLKLGAMKQHYYFEVLTERDFLFPLKLKTILYKNQFSTQNHEI